MAGQSPERPKQYHIAKAFKALNTKANRTSIDPNEFSWLENAMPVGESNLRIVPTYANVPLANGAAATWANTVVNLQSENINLKNYLFGFQKNGGAQAFDVGAQSMTTVAASSTFNASGPYIAQWKSERVVIGDPNAGLYSWDGNNLVAIGSVGFIGITNGGSNYTSAPAVTISGPDDPNGIQAVAEATITSGVVSTVFLTQPGIGYTNASNLSVTFAGGGGANAAASASLITFKTGTVQLVVESGGSNISNNAAVAITISGGGGTGAAAKPIIAGNAITSVVMTNPGQNYTNTANMTVSVSGGGVTGAVLTPVLTTQPISDVASFSGRIWVAQGRAITFSAADSYNDFISISAGNFVITDNTLHGNINALLTANNFLYIWGDDSINVFSDVQVTSTGSTVFTNTNVSASIGTRRVNAIFPYFRSILFMNDYGVYALVGSTTTKISDALDGIFPLIDFTQPVSGGQVLINSIICAAFNFYYKDPVRGTIPLQAVFFEKKWFLTNQGTLAQITSIPVSGKVNLYGTAGTNLVQLYGDTTSAAVASNVQTALAHFGDPIRTKQALKFAIEASSTIGAQLNVTVDSEQRASPTYMLTNIVTWSNASGTVLGWTNASGTLINWYGGSGYELYANDAQQYGKYLGLTITSNDAAFVINTFEFEHEFGARF